MKKGRFRDLRNVLALRSLARDERLSSRPLRAFSRKAGDMADSFGSSASRIDVNCVSCGALVTITSELGKSAKCPKCNKYIDGYSEPIPNEELPRSGRPKISNKSDALYAAGLRNPRGDQRDDVDENETE